MSQVSAAIPFSQMTHHELLARVRRAILSVALGVSISVCIGASPTFWRVSTQAEFLRGDVEALSVDADGHLVLGRVADVFFDTTAPVLWSLAIASDGALWAGSGNDGRLYRVEPDGEGSVVFDTDELDIHAVVAGAEGVVFAATSPDGRVYRNVSPLFANRLLIRLLTRVRSCFEVFSSRCK